MLNFSFPLSPFSLAFNFNFNFSKHPNYIASYSVRTLEILFGLLWWASATLEVAFRLFIRYSP